jgi:hypothetical protein
VLQQAQQQQVLHHHLQAQHKQLHHIFPKDLYYRYV